MISRTKSSDNDNSFSQLQSATPFPSATPSPAETSSPAATPSSTPTRSPTASPSPAATSSPTPTAISTPTPSPSTQTVPTQVSTPSEAPSITPVETPEVASGPGINQPVAILSKPLPNYTAKLERSRSREQLCCRLCLGRRALEPGVVRLPNGLSERAIAATQNIKFALPKNGCSLNCGATRAQLQSLLRSVTTNFSL